MSYVNKAFNRNNYSLTETKVHKTQYIDSGSDGVFSVNYRSGSMSGSKIISALPDVSGSYWNSLLNLFYASGSQKISASGESGLGWAWYTHGFLGHGGSAWNQ